MARSTRSRSAPTRRCRKSSRRSRPPGVRAEMELAALLVVLGLAVVAAAYIVRPLREGTAREPDERERHLSELRAEQDQTLVLLHELDMDYAMGRVEPEDYQASRAARIRRGAALLREIDEL